ncbi:MAG TPA: ABC transporter ATP-binding protein [Candidatus Limnocylindrales bacterium]|jgi:ABC-type lipoprotein export system ATPase subunit|nr:ABC transporter ATP-binding protein [Candidatus Limnocylindrales bacterium]
MPVLTLHEVSKVYPAAVPVTALDGVSLAIEAGEFVAIMGASGSGKSTLMNLLGLLDRPTAGSYLFEERDVARLSDGDLARIRRERIGFVFQSFNLFARKSGLDNVALPLTFAGVPRNDRHRRARLMLERVGLSDRAHHRPSELSGGQQQRVAIARALVNEPALILADEPTGNLDSRTGAEILDVLRGLNETGVTLLVVTHDERVASMARRIIRLSDGRVVADERTPGDRPRAAVAPEAAA